MMYHCPKANIFFVHIPKNGGTSTYRALERLGAVSHQSVANDLGATLAEVENSVRKGEWHHQKLGRLKLSHIPLRTLERHFPEMWSSFVDAQSFAFVRNPKERFISATLQYLSEFHGTNIQSVFDPLVKKTADEIRTRITNRDGPNSVELIHFVPQVEFTHHSGKQRVDEIFPLERPDAMSDWLQKVARLDLDLRREHSRRAPIQGARPLTTTFQAAGRMLPLTIRKPIYRRWVSTPLFQDASAMYDQVNLGTQTHEFLESYYAADLSLYRRTMGRY